MGVVFRGTSGWKPMGGFAMLRTSGEVAERPKAAVLKTVEGL